MNLLCHSRSRCEQKVGFDGLKLQDIVFDKSKQTDYDTFNGCFLLKLISGTAVRVVKGSLFSFGEINKIIPKET